MEVEDGPPHNLKEVKRRSSERKSGEQSNSASNDWTKIERAPKTTHYLNTLTPYDEKVDELKRKQKAS